VPITDFEKYKALTSDNSELKVDFRPLNADALLKIGAVRVTHRGLDDGAFDPDPTKGFSLVSGYNDAVGGSGGTKKWPNNPKFMSVLKDMLTARPHDIGAHKYLQIVESARDLGLKDKDIFLPNAKLPEGYRKGGRVKLI
jgi:hypothetical protein